MSIVSHAVLAHVQLVLKAKLVRHLLLRTFTQTHRVEGVVKGLCLAVVQYGTAPEFVIVIAFSAIVALENTFWLSYANIRKTFIFVQPKCYRCL